MEMSGLHSELTHLRTAPRHWDSRGSTRRTAGSQPELAAPKSPVQVMQTDLREEQRRIVRSAAAAFAWSVLAFLTAHLLVPRWVDLQRADLRMLLPGGQHPASSWS